MQATEERGSAASRLGSACALVREGQVVEATRRLTELLDQSDAKASRLEPAERAVLLATLIECLLARGDLAGAAALSDRLVPLIRLDGVAGAVATYAAAEVAAIGGDPEHAIPLYLAAGVLAEGEDLSAELAPWRVGAVLAMVRSRRRGAGELAAEHHEEALRSGSAYAVALSLRTLATTDAGGRRLPLLREARAALTGVGARRLAAQIDTDIAGLLALGHDPLDVAEAIELLRDAEGYAGDEQLWPLHGRVRRLLVRLGQEPRRVHAETLDSLTDAERRVAALAADGLTNRQIAERLPVSVKAVEWHLSRIYRKLGIPSRRDLAAALGIAV